MITHFLETGCVYSPSVLILLSLMFLLTISYRWHEASTSIDLNGFSLLIWEEAVIMAFSICKEVQYHIHTFLKQLVREWQNYISPLKTVTTYNSVWRNIQQRKLYKWWQFLTILTHTKYSKLFTKSDLEIHSILCSILSNKTSKMYSIELTKHCHEGLV